MRQIYFNQFEKLVSTDLNNAQASSNKSLLDDFLYNYFGNPAGGVLGASLKGSYVSALASSIAAGVGFFYDNTQTGYNALFRMINAASAISVTHGTANTQDRIDLVCLAPNFAVDATKDASRYVKTGGTGPITLTSVHKGYQDTYTLQVVAGTPGGSPAVPSTPSGYIPLYSAYIHANTGMASGADITDKRTIMTFNVANSGHVYGLSTTLQGQLDQIDAQLVICAAAAGVSAVNTNHRIAVGTTIQAQLNQLDNALAHLVAINPATQSPYALSTTLSSGDCGKVFLVNSANGAMTFNLPTPVADFKFKIKDVGGVLNTNTCTMHRHSTELFENLAADFVFKANGGEWEVSTDGTNWIITGR